MGDALSSASFFLNCANLGCTFIGQFAAAEGCGTVAAGRFITNTAGYTNYLAGPTTGITYSVGLSIYSKKKE